MPPTTSPLVFDYKDDEGIPTKHKEAIRQLYGFAKVPVECLMTQYKLGGLLLRRSCNTTRLSARELRVLGDLLF